MPSLPHTISGTIQSITNDTVTVMLHNNETVTLPKHLTSESAVVGTAVHLAVFADTNIAEEHERLAKAVLTELLRGT